MTEVCRRGHKSPDDVILILFVEQSSDRTWIQWKESTTQRDNTILWDIISEHSGTGIQENISTYLRSSALPYDCHYF